MDISRHQRSLLVAAIIAFGVLTSGLALVACGDDDEGNADGGGPAASEQVTGNGVDRALVDQMRPHHELAVEMAEIAERRGQSRFVKDLAADIIRTQTAEIKTLRSIAARLEAAGVKATDLGVPEHQTGMTADLSRLRTADPFDRAFIDMMIPHHQGAIRMGRAELAKGRSDRAKALAREIIAAQSREIRAMNEHRAEAFGGPSPAGGVPGAGEHEAKDGGAMHEG